MLKITVPAFEYFNNATQQFGEFPAVDLELEHSLVSLSKWESRFERPFLDGGQKTREETLGYLECMILNDNVDPNIYQRFSQANIDEINEYINKKMTATWFTELPGKPKPVGRKEVITSEIIYFWMVALQIPFEAQTWHLQRLLTFIRVVSEKNAPKKKMSKREIAEQNRMLNEQRRAQLNTKG